MSRESEEPIILSGLDIGTKKISLVVAETDPFSNEMQIISISSARSRGVRKGNILDPDLCVESIREAIDKSESALGLHILETYISFGPSGTEIFPMDISIDLHEDGVSLCPVTSNDMKKAVETSISAARKRCGECLLHILVLGYSVDGGDKTIDPRGLKGVSLSVEVLAIFVPSGSAIEACKCAEKAGLNVRGVIHKSISSAFGSLLPDEMNAGSVSVDIGAGTTSVAFCSGGLIMNVGHFPIGGDHVTNDVSNMLNIPVSKAEYLKREVSLIENEDGLYDELEFEIEGKPFLTTVGDVLNIISPRIEEIFSNFLKPAIFTFCAGEKCGKIAFSGGVSSTSGFLDFSEDFFPGLAIIANPVGISSLPPHGRGPESVSALGIFNYINTRDENHGLYLEPFMSEMPESSILSERPEGHKTFHGVRVKKIKGIRRSRGFFARFFQELKNAFSELF